MLFTIRRLGRTVLTLMGKHRFEASSGVRSSVGAFVSVLLIGIGASAHAQSQAGSTVTGVNSAVPGVTQSSTSTGSTASGNPAQGTPDTTDPVARFLADKGLLPSTKPVVELAQQVRDKASDMASDLVISAMNFLGVPYRRGGSSEESGFDCSGFTRHVFESSIGLILPRRAAEQANSPDLIPVKRDDLKPGDLVFFNTLRHTFSHVGIYIGENKFIHSPRPGGRVRVEDIRETYWQQRYDGARRAPAIAAQQINTPPPN